MIAADCSTRRRSRFTFAAAAALAMLALTQLLAACSESSDTPKTVDQNEMSCSAPDAEYAYGAAPAQRLDVFKRLRGTPKGTIVFVHGGSFTGGDKRGSPGSDCPSAAFANLHMGPLLRQRENGWDLVSINYRLVTAGDAATKFPGALVDTIEAVKWVTGEGGKEAKVDPTRVVVAGHSAGGTIAALMGSYNGTSGDLPGVNFPTIDGWIGISAPLDYRDAATKQNIDRWVAGNAFGYSTAQADPMTAYLRPERAPGYLIHANNDSTIPVVNSENMSAAHDIPLDNVGDLSYPAGWEWSTHWPMSHANYPDLLDWLNAR